MKVQVTNSSVMATWDGFLPFPHSTVSYSFTRLLLNLPENLGGKGVVLYLFCKVSEWNWFVELSADWKGWVEVEIHG